MLECAIISTAIAMVAYSASTMLLHRMLLDAGTRPFFNTDVLL
jgi:hypothetical protein